MMIYYLQTSDPNKVIRIHGTKDAPEIFLMEAVDGPLGFNLANVLKTWAIQAARQEAKDHGLTLRQTNAIGALIGDRYGSDRQY